MYSNVLCNFVNVQNCLLTDCKYHDNILEQRKSVSDSVEYKWHIGYNACITQKDTFSIVVFSQLTQRGSTYDITSAGARCSDVTS